MNRVRGVDRATLAPVVIASAILAGCASPAPAPSGTGTTAEALPTSTSTTTDDGLALGDIRWVYTPPPITLGGPNGAFTIQAGTLADVEPIVNLRVPWRAELGEGLAREPAIGAPHGGAVVYVADDGAASEVHRVEIAADGADEVLATLDEVVWDIVVAPDESAAYAAVVDRIDPARDLGVVRILLDGSGVVEPILPAAPPGTAGEIRRVATLAFQVHLAISSDGAHLVRRTCQEAGTCLVEVLDLATGRTIELPDRQVLGVVDGVIVALGCHGPGCGLHAIDFQTGAVASAGIDVSGPVVEVAGEPVVVAMLGDMERPVTVEAVDPGSGRRTVLHRLPDGTNIIYSDFLFLQMDLPEGLIHVIEVTPIGGEGDPIQVDERHLLLSIPDRRAFEIPRPAFRQPEGFGIEG